MLAQQLYRINKLTFIDIQPDGAAFLGLFSALIWFNINNASIWLASPSESPLYNSIPQPESDITTSNSATVRRIRFIAY